MKKTPWRNRVVALTGAASGIGRALAKSLAARGAYLALSDKDAAALEDTARLCAGGTRERIRTYVVDVADRNAMRQYAESVDHDFGRVNAIINNAGVSLTAMVTEQTLDDIDWVLDINLRGVINGSQIFLPYLIESGDGLVINLSSIFGVISVPGASAYNASKFAVRGYTEALTMEMSMDDYPVSVHCVHPGGVKTNIVRHSRLGREKTRDALTRKFDRIARTTSEAAAEIIIRGVDRGRPRIFVGSDALALYGLSTLLGSGYQKLIQRRAKRLYP